jgi:hypothetical protein
MRKGAALDPLDERNISHHLNWPLVSIPVVGRHRRSTHPLFQMIQTIFPFPIRNPFQRFPQADTALTCQVHKHKQAH